MGPFSTLVFHFFGKHFDARARLANWNPRDLPDPKEKWEQEPYASCIAGLIFAGIFLLLINGYLSWVYHGLIALASAAIVVQLQGVTPMFMILSDSMANAREVDKLVGIINTFARLGLIIRMRIW